MTKVLILFFSIGVLFADEYDFDLSELEPKNYEYNGYLRIDNKTKEPSTKEHQNYFHAEALLDFSYFYEKFTFKNAFMANYDHIQNFEDDYFVSLNELYAEYKHNKNHSFLVGKKSLKWGKGYFYNPVAFLDREKDLSQPTQVREGFSLLRYNYNKSFRGDLKNLSLDLIYLASSKDLNSDFDPDSNNLATRLYFLYYDTDIDLIYCYSDQNNDKIGLDFSKNLQTNFEIHAEYSKVFNEKESYLMGLRYLTSNELTIISEYFYNTNNFFVTLLTQKEPLDLPYLNVYAKNITNLDSDLKQNKLGFNYSFKNNMIVDLSYNHSTSELIWLQIKWNF